jgi:CRP-like cAMP-binding protein
MEEMKINQMENAEIKIPFNRKELSEYINVNRSALSRVLSSLEEDNIISFNKNKFKILDLEKVKKIMNG